MHHRTDIKPVIENCTTSFFFCEMKESISEHYFHIFIFTYLTVTLIFTNNTIWMTSTQTFIQRKGDSSKTTQSTCQEYASYQVWSLPFTNLQSMDKAEVLLTKEKKKKAPENINLQFTVVCYISPLFARQIKRANGFFMSSDLINKNTHDLN